MSSLDELLKERNDVASEIDDVESEISNLNAKLYTFEFRYEELSAEIEKYYKNTPKDNPRYLKDFCDKYGINLDSLLQILSVKEPKAKLKMPLSKWPEHESKNVLHYIASYKPVEASDE